MKRSVMVVGVIALLLAGLAPAAVKKGDVELDGLGGYISVNGDGGADEDIIFVSARVGYFVTDNIQVAGVGAYMCLDNTDVDIYGIGVAGKFHFMPDRQWVPYAGGQFMWASADMGGASTDGYIYGPLAGVRYEITPTTDLFVEGQYNLFGGDLNDALDDAWVIMVGFVHQLR
ncbi:MAG: outer membrane beta-barrel protein [Sedimentisphaerales bacterium]|nr:outer membrane beta-barrel protein [Sedimentisphaerales bacterium]